MDVLRCNTYESIIIFTDKLSEMEYNISADRYQKILRELPADIINVDKLGKKKLAYPVKDCINGWYLLVHFRCEPENLKTWEKMLRINDYVLKWVTTLVDKDREFSDVGTLIDDAIKSEQPDGESKKIIDVFDLIYGTEEKPHPHSRVTRVKTPKLFAFSEEELDIIAHALEQADEQLSLYCDVADVYVLDKDEIAAIEDEDERSEAQELKDYDEALKNAHDIINRKRGRR